MQTGLANRVVIVTGGSSGIGRAAALAFGREDARVAVTYRADKEAAASCAAGIEAAGAAAAAFPFDLGSAGSAADLVRQGTRRWGGLDVLVNCAGGRERNGPRDGRVEDETAQRRGPLPPPPARPPRRRRRGPAA